VLPWQPPALAPAAAASGCEMPAAELLELPAPAAAAAGIPPDDAALQATAPPDPNAAIGTAVHRALEWLTRQPAAARHAAAVSHAAAQAAAQAGVPSHAAARVQAVVETILASPALADLLDPQRLEWAGNEVAVGWHGETLRIDRLVAQRGPQGRCWGVLDYKLQHAPQELADYREQLARYRDAVRAGRPEDTVRAAFVTGTGALVELPDR
jgi:ATP-dependent helicase/nuclease subunit A